jgi:hypothetical protein
MASNPPPQLSPSDLFDSQAKLDAIRLQTYNRLLTSVHERIKFVSKQHNSPQMTHFDVPEWQLGCPRFDVKDCILYLVWNLRHAGFQVLYVSPNRLLISWKEQSIQYYQEESPIRQAMLAAAATPSSQQQPAPPVTNGKESKKKAGSYKPATEGVAGLLAQGGRRGGGSTITFI